MYVDLLSCISGFRLSAAGLRSYEPSYRKIKGVAGGCLDFCHIAGYIYMKKYI